MRIPRIVAILSLPHPQHEVTPHVSLLSGALAMDYEYLMPNAMHWAWAIGQVGRPATVVMGLLSWIAQGAWWHGTPG